MKRVFRSLFCLCILGVFVLGLIACEGEEKPHEHTFGEWTETKVATCTEAGEEKRTCIECGEEETREIAALGHDEKADGTSSRCGEILETIGLTYTLKDDDTYEVTGYGGDKTTLTYLKIPSTHEGKKVTSIKSSAFLRCDKLETVDISAGVKEIGSNAFAYCEGLKNVTVPSGVTSIEYGVFFYCRNLPGIELPDTVTSIGEKAFEDCNKLESIVIPEGVVSIGKSAFCSCRNLTAITLPGSLKSVEEMAIYECDSLEKMNYTGDIASWCDISFGGRYTNPLTRTHDLYINDTLVTEIVIPDTITTVKAYAFSGCHSLTSLTIPDSVEVIGECAFSGCAGLTDLTIPDSVEVIGECAFSGCDSLCTVRMSNNIKYIGSGFPQQCCNEYDNAYYIGNETNPYLILMKCKDEDITSVRIADTTKIIYQGAFLGCESLTEINIPDSVIYVYDDAFTSCTSLQYNVKDGVCYLGNSVNPYLLLLDVIDKTASSVTIADTTICILSWALMECTNLTSIVIPQGITCIGDWAFAGCSKLASVTIPDSVLRIGSAAFGLGTYAFLHREELKITYEGTTKQWKQIVKGPQWNLYPGDHTVVCSDGDVEETVLIS